MWVDVKVVSLQSRAALRPLCSWRAGVHDAVVSMMS